MRYLVGEWVFASIFMGLAFLVATIGVVGLGWWVMRGDRLNRRIQHPSPEERLEQH